MDSRRSHQRNGLGCVVQGNWILCALAHVARHPARRRFGARGHVLVPVLPGA